MRAAALSMQILPTRGLIRVDGDASWGRFQSRALKTFRFYRLVGVWDAWIANPVKGRPALILRTNSTLWLCPNAGVYYRYIKPRTFPKHSILSGYALEKTSTPERKYVRDTTPRSSIKSFSLKSSPYGDSARKSFTETV